MEKLYGFELPVLDAGDLLELLLIRSGGSCTEALRLQAEFYTESARRCTELLGVISGILNTDPDAEITMDGCGSMINVIGPNVLSEYVDSGLLVDPDLEDDLEEDTEEL